MDTMKTMWPGWDTVRLIGRGGFGAVYEIQRKIFDETEKAALKVITIPQNDGDIEEMRSDGYDDETITATLHGHLKSIVGEYSTMRKMNGSSNIVNCDDVRYELHADGIGWDVYIKMELLTPLAKCLSVSIPEETVVKLAKDICAALDLCRKYDVVHRDIKPQNIFLSDNGDFKLGDFGIAKTVEKTMGGTKIGTYKYMAPEVYNNQPYGATADIYSLGLVLYWMLNERRLPFMPQGKPTVGADEEARHRRLSGEEIPAPKNGSEQLKQIVLKACAFDSKDRFPSAAQMLDALRNLGNDSNVTPVAESPENVELPEEEATVGPAFTAATERTEGPVWNNSEKNRLPEENQTVGPVFSAPERVQTKSDVNEKKNPIFKIAAIGVAILILILLLRSCFGGADKPLETETIEPTEMPTEMQTEPPSTEPEETEIQTEPEETLPVQVEWSEWMDELPDYVDSTAYEVEEQMLYRSRNLETTSSTTSKKKDGWTYVDTVDGTGDFGPWSSWSDTKLSETKDREVESQTRYRYRTKETTTSTKSEKSGWKLYDTTYKWGDYGSWSSWSTTKATKSDSRQVETKTQYSYRDKWTTQEYSAWSGWSGWSDSRQSTNDLKKEETRTVYGYYYFQCPACGAHMHLWSHTCFTWAGGCGKAVIPESSWHEVWSTTSWDNAGLRDWYGTGKYYTYINGELVFKWDDGNGKAKTQYRYATRTLDNVTNYGSWSEYSDTEYTESSSREVRTRTVYRYRDRQEIPTYHFYRWSDWSDWSQTAVSETDNRQVETTKYYRSRERVTVQTHYFERWTDWTEFLAEKVTASETTEVETKQQFRFRSK